MCISTGRFIDFIWFLLLLSHTVSTQCNNRFFTKIFESIYFVKFFSFVKLLLILKRFVFFNYFKTIEFAVSAHMHVI